MIYFSSNMDRQIVTEIEIQSHFRHPNILRIFCHFSDAENIYIVLELAGYGEVYYIVNREQRLESERASAFISQVCCGLEELHRKKVIHRDIKPENIFIGHDYTLKLGDFGWSTRTLTGRRNTFCGTKDYVAPEMAMRKPYTSKIDVWMIGILAFEFVHGFPPFSADDLKSQCKLIEKCEYQCQDHVPEEAIDFISCCLKLDPNDRPTISELLQHKWLVMHRHESNPYIGSFYRTALQEKKQKQQLKEEVQALEERRRLIEQEENANKKNLHGEGETIYSAKKVKLVSTIDEDANKKIISNGYYSSEEEDEEEEYVNEDINSVIITKQQIENASEAANAITAQSQNSVTNVGGITSLKTLKNARLDHIKKKKN